MSDSAAVHIYVSGKVQGVGFRYDTQRHALYLGLTGFTRNLPDGRVEVEAEGDRKKIEDLIQHIRTGPPRAEVAAVDVSWKSPTGRFHDFSITR